MTARMQGHSTATETVYVVESSLQDFGSVDFSLVN